MFQTFIKQIELGVWVCYNDNATQQKMTHRRCVFLSSDKNACSTFAYRFWVRKLCSSIGAVRFLCAASAAHFLFIRKNRAKRRIIK